MELYVLGFSGAGGTGKTTLAEIIGWEVSSPVEYLKREFYNNPAFGSFETTEDMFRFQLGILFAQFSIERQALKDRNAEYRSELADYILPIERSSIDYAAYMLKFTEKIRKSKAKKNKPLQDFIQKYVDICIDHANKSYNAIVYFPPNRFTNSDKANIVKERDPISILETDKYIQKLLKSVTIPVIKIPKGLTDALDRVSFIETNLSKLDKKASLEMTNLEIK